MKTTKQIITEFELNRLDDAVEAIDGVLENMAFYGHKLQAIQDAKAYIEEAIENRLTMSERIKIAGAQ